MRVMRPLSELSYRLWPSDRLPPGVEQPRPYFNLTAAAFKKIYTAVVNPRLKAAGFKCSGTVARRDRPWLSEAAWLLVSGGRGQLVIAAHPREFPARNFRALEPGEAFDYSTAAFKRVMDLCPGARTSYGVGHTMLDLGTNETQGRETAEVFAELFVAQGVPYLTELATALEQLLAVDATTFDATMPELAQRLGLCPDELMPERLWTATFMTCVHFRAGRPTARALCELALSCEPVSYPPGLRDFLERLARGEGPLHRIS
jgi:hypothetical protein